MEEIRLQAKIEQWIEWAILKIKEPIREIFWKEVFPRFNSAAYTGSLTCTFLNFQGKINLWWKTPTGH